MGEGRRKSSQHRRKIGPGNSVPATHLLERCHLRTEVPIKEYAPWNPGRTSFICHRGPFSLLWQESQMLIVTLSPQIHTLNTMTSSWRKTRRLGKTGLFRLALRVEISQPKAKLTTSPLIDLNQEFLQLPTCFLIKFDMNDGRIVDG